MVRREKNGQPDTRCQFRNSPSLKYILFTVPHSLLIRRKKACVNMRVHVFFINLIIQVHVSWFFAKLWIAVRLQCESFFLYIAITKLAEVGLGSG